MAALSLSAVSVGVYNKLNVVGVTALVSTRIFDEFPRDPDYPCLAYSVSKREARGMGTGELAEILLRVSVLSKAATGAEAQAILAAVELALKDASVTVSGYRMAGLVVWTQTVPVGTVEINGEKVNEWVTEFLFWLEP
jgi:hypothetical protein